MLNYYDMDKSTDLQICLVLFQRCNLRCGFCFQDHVSSQISIQKILSIPEKIKPELAEIAEKLHLTRVTWRVWGGELFADDIPDQIFRAYQTLCTRLREVDQSLGLETVFCFTSNFVFWKTDRALDLVKKTGAQTATSYDPVFRFKTQGQLDLWKKNVQIFKPASISVTLTKQSIQKYITQDWHFDLLKPWHVFIQYYIWSRGWEIFAPSQDDLFKFYKHCIEKKLWFISEIQSIQKSLQHPIGRYCTCNKSCLWLDQRLTFNCLRRSSNLDWSQFFQSEPEQKDYTLLQAREALQRGGCMLCQHLSHCRGFCLASMLHKSWSSQGCALKRIYTWLREMRDNEALQ